MCNKRLLIFGGYLLWTLLYPVTAQTPSPASIPKISVSCSEFPYMKIDVVFSQPFIGVVYASGHRTAWCQAQGDGRLKLNLTLNYMAPLNSVNDCGMQMDPDSGEQTVSLVVRYNKNLELSEDKTIAVSCNNSEYTNSLNERSSLKMFLVDDNGAKTNKVILGRSYVLQVEATHPDAKDQLQVGNCFSYGGVGEGRVELSDVRGCPVDPTLSGPFTYNTSSRYSQARIYSMYKLPATNLININCLVSICQIPNCVQVNCDDSKTLAIDPRLSRQQNALMTSLTATVMEPTDTLLPLVDCSLYSWWWLLGLCITFGVLFLVMLIVNILLCSALRCSCAKQEAVEHEEGSVVEDYDPYKGSIHDWASYDGSHYGSRFSLNSKHDLPASTIDYSTLGRSNGRVQEDQLSHRSPSRYSHHSAGPI